MSVDALPEYWILVRLEDIAEIVGGGTPDRRNPSYFGGNIPWVTPTDITRLDDLWIDDTAEAITVKGLNSSSATLLPVGTVLMTSRASIGLTAINQREMCTNQGFANFNCNGQLILNEYLARWLTANTERWIQLAGGTTFKEISKSTLAKVEIPLPPLPEQHRIAIILREAHEIRKLQRQANEKVQQIVLALFYEMFGDPEKNPRKWKLSLLSKVGLLDRGRSQHRPRDAAHLYGGPYPFIQTGDVANSDGWITSYSQTYSEAGLAQSRLWEKGTLCITIAANIAKTAILTFDACFPDSIVGFTSGPTVVSEYVRQWFVTIQNRLEKYAPQAAQKNINLEVLRNLQIPLPPLHLQNKFASLVTEIHENTIQQQNAHRLLDTLFQSLLAQALNGELTIIWLEEHAQELAQATQERDRLLQEIRKSVRPVEPAQLPAVQVEITERKDLTVELSKTQRALLNIVNRQNMTYFIITKLHDEIELGLHDEFEGLDYSLDSIRRDLHFLAAVGLLKELTLAAEGQPGNIYYIAVYRSLLADDDSKREDLSVLDSSFVEEVSA